MYLQTFNLQNVEIIDCSVTKGVERVTPNGVVVGGKEYELDVIIWSTGFSLPLADHVDYRVLGRGGKTKQEIWKENDGMATLYGIASNGTPNYFNFGSFQAGGSVNFPSVLNAVGFWSCAAIVADCSVLTPYPTQDRHLDSLRSR
jgi:cyclohexanone monooxygenase